MRKAKKSLIPLIALAIVGLLVLFSSHNASRGIPYEIFKQNICGLKGHILRIEYKRESYIKELHK